MEMSHNRFFEIFRIKIRAQASTFFSLRFFLYFIDIHMVHEREKCTPLSSYTVIHFENGHYGSSGPLLIRTWVPSRKQWVQILFQEEKFKQAGKCSKGSLFRECINVQRENWRRKPGIFESTKKKGGGGSNAFNINQALKLGRSQTCHISDLSVSKRTWIYAREKNTPWSTMMLLNCVDCLVSEYLPVPKFKSLIVLLL